MFGKRNPLQQDIDPPQSPLLRRGEAKSLIPPVEQGGRERSEQGGGLPVEQGGRERSEQGGGLL